MNIKSLINWWRECIIMYYLCFNGGHVTARHLPVAHCVGFIQIGVLNKTPLQWNVIHKRIKSYACWMMFNWNPTMKITLTNLVINQITCPRWDLEAMNCSDRWHCSFIVDHTQLAVVDLTWCAHVHHDVDTVQLHPAETLLSSLRLAAQCHNFCCRRRCSDEIFVCCLSLPLPRWVAGTAQCYSVRVSECATEPGTTRVSRLLDDGSSDQIQSGASFWSQALIALADDRRVVEQGNRGRIHVLDHTRRHIRCMRRYIGLRAAAWLQCVRVVVPAAAVVAEESQLYLLSNDGLGVWWI